MLKKYGKSYWTASGTLPLHLHSEQKDGQSTESGRRWAAAGGRHSPVLSGPSLPSWGPRAPGTRSPVLFPLGSHPLPSTERGLLREAEPLERRVFGAVGDGDRATWPGTVSWVCAWRPRLWREALGGPGGCGPPHLTSRDLATFTPLSRAGPTFLRRQWSKIERQSQPAVLYKKGAIDSGISETNLTLVFRLFQTIKIKAGLRWLPSSESCYVFLIWQG